ncbi:hypothetical protein T492DRAFT_912181, partial [Pavlovales sp. CCMP2436]
RQRTRQRTRQLWRRARRARRRQARRRRARRRRARQRAQRARWGRTTARRCSTAVASTAPLCLRPRATASPSAVSPSYGRTGGATRGSYNAGRGRRANDQQYTEAVRSALKSGATEGETAVATELTLPPSSDHARPGVDLICLRFALRASRFARSRVRLNLSQPAGP